MAKPKTKPQDKEPDFVSDGHNKDFQTPRALFEKYSAAQNRRHAWTGLWQDCYDYALPQRGQFLRAGLPGERKTDRLFDATASDAVEQLASSLLSQLTPPWSEWVGLVPGPDLDPVEAEQIAPKLQSITDTLQSHFHRSNFAVEMHQCYLDLVTGGTASLMVESAAPGAFSALNFRAIPLHDLVLDESNPGQLDITYRKSSQTMANIIENYPLADHPPEVIQKAKDDPTTKFDIIDCVLPFDQTVIYASFFADHLDHPQFLQLQRLSYSPFINFRWLKLPGEIYGRSPVMKALPDIKTANKVVELILKNASIAVTGIWQADDDGVLNPANIKLVPGSIIPKAVGSAGLKPLDMPGRFDVSQIVLDDLRGRINHALLADRLSQIQDRNMTATEVLERTAEMARIIGASYGRLQSELLTPLVLRAIQILRKRGEIPSVQIDGRYVALDFRSPLARAQAQRDIQNTLSWIKNVIAMGPEASESIDLAAAGRWLGRSLGVPAELIKASHIPTLTNQNSGNLSELAQAANAMMATQHDNQEETDHVV